MRVLLSCSGGMSSSYVADAIVDEAKKDGADIVVDATGTESVKEMLNKHDYDLVLLAPQVAYRKKYIDGIAGEKGLQVLQIKGTEYNPIGAVNLYKEIKAALN